jgi:hypothetical protein
MINEPNVMPSEPLGTGPPTHKRYPFRFSIGMQKPYIPAGERFGGRSFWQNAR